MIASIGMTGCGKTNALMNFLDKKRDAFHDIIIFTGSTTEEAFFGLETFFGEEALVSTTEGATVEEAGVGAVVLDDARTIFFLL
jgi:hypothetical protein